MPERTGWRGEWPSPGALRKRIAETLRVEVAEADCCRFLDFLRLLERWAAKFNLISATSRGEIVDRHLIDSLAVLDLAGDAVDIADLGSGAGFPGVPLAVALPESRVFLVEPRAHRANFLRQAVRSLLLSNAEVFAGRGDAFAAAHAVDLVVARGVRLDEVRAFASRALAPGGRVIAMVKNLAGEPSVDGFAIARRLNYGLPDGSRHVLLELLHN